MFHIHRIVCGEHHVHTWGRISISWKTEKNRIRNSDNKIIINRCVHIWMICQLWRPCYRWICPAVTKSCWSTPSLVPDLWWVQQQENKTGKGKKGVGRMWPCLFLQNLSDNDLQKFPKLHTPWVLPPTAALWYCSFDWETLLDQYC